MAHTTITRHNAQTLLLLEEWLVTDMLASQYDTYIAEKVLSGKSFYTDTLAVKGKKAAEKAFREWDSQYHMADFASYVRRTARGLLEVARADTEGGFMQTILVQAPAFGFPHRASLGDAYHRVVLGNQHMTRPEKLKHSEIFSPNGVLPFKAITLEVSEQRGKRYGQLGIVLPQWRIHGEGGKDNYTVVTIDLTGAVAMYGYRPTICMDGALMHALDISEAREVIYYSSATAYRRSHFDATLGFPNSLGYLHQVLPLLKEHLKSLAKRIRTE